LLAVIVGPSGFTPGDVTATIIPQVQEINRIVAQLDRSWIEPENVREFLQVLLHDRGSADRQGRDLEKQNLFWNNYVTVSPVRAG
jgi:hypothetical protein